MRDNHCPNAFLPSSFYSECLAVADSLCFPSDLIISFKSLYEKLRKVSLSAPPLHHQSGNTFLLNSGDEANLKDFMESDYRNTLPASNVTCVAENSGVSYAAAATLRVASEDSSLDRPATYRNEYYLTNFERAHFHPENVTPERPCTAYFNSDIFADSNAVFGALKTRGFPGEAIRCLQRKPSSDMLITFANARV